MIGGGGAGGGFNDGWRGSSAKWRERRNQWVCTPERTGKGREILNESVLHRIDTKVLQWRERNMVCDCRYAVLVQCKISST